MKLQPGIEVDTEGATSFPPVPERACGTPGSKGWIGMAYLRGLDATDNS
jgi:hypothetical protein